MIFKDLAPLIIAVTAVVCGVLLLRIDRKNIFTLDGIFSILGTCIGLIITGLNLLYSNNYMITVGPILAITASAYLRYKGKMNQYTGTLPLGFGQNTINIVGVIFWGAAFVALISYFTAPLYTRPLVFFLSISLAVTMLSFELFSLKPNNTGVLIAIFKILVVSIMLRASANLISPYPIGSDPWAHQLLISELMSAGSINALIGTVNSYYLSFPLTHLYIISSHLLGNIDIKLSMFIVGAILALSTVFVYLFVKKITSNENIALISMLLLNFADFHLEWSIEIIAMSFGLALYALLLFMVFRKKEFDKLNYALIIFVFTLITLTHTISSFIAFVTVVCLYAGSLLYGKIYPGGQKEFYIDGKLCIIFFFILFGYWTYSNSHFFVHQLDQLKISLMAAKFLVRPSIPVAQSQLGNLINIFGFLIFLAFEIIGILWYTSKNHASQAKIALAFATMALLFIFFIFPAAGMRDFLPYRWPAFIYGCMVLFVSQGLILSFYMIRKEFRAITFTSIIFILVFFMITNTYSNGDTPNYGVSTTLTYWTVSEMTSLKTLNTTYDGTIFADFFTSEMPITVYLNRSDTGSYRLTPLGSINWSDMGDGLIVLRARTLMYPVQGEYGGNHYDILLGDDFRRHLDNSSIVVFDSGPVKGYVQQ